MSRDRGNLCRETDAPEGQETDLSEVSLSAYAVAATPKMMPDAMMTASMKMHEQHCVLLSED